MTKRTNDDANINTGADTDKATKTEADIEYIKVETNLKSRGGFWYKFLAMIVALLRVTHNPKMPKLPTITGGFMKRGLIYICVAFTLVSAGQIAFNAINQTNSANLIRVTYDGAVYGVNYGIDMIPWTITKKETLSNMEKKVEVLDWQVRQIQDKINEPGIFGRMSNSVARAWNAVF